MWAHRTACSSLAILPSDRRCSPWALAQRQNGLTGLAHLTAVAQESRAVAFCKTRQLRQAFSTWLHWSRSHQLQRLMAARAATLLRQRCLAHALQAWKERLEGWKSKRAAVLAAQQHSQRALLLKALVSGLRWVCCKSSTKEHSPQPPCFAWLCPQPLAHAKPILLTTALSMLNLKDCLLRWDFQNLRPIAQQPRT